MAQSADELTPEQRVQALAQMIHVPDARARKSVAIALGKLGAQTHTATTPLCEMLSDPDEGVRVLACQALGRVCDPDALGALCASVHDESAQVRSGVLFALASLLARGSLSSEAREAIFTPLVVMAFDPDDGVRADAAATLGALGDERTAEPLLVLASDDAPRVRANAAASLGLAGDDRAVDVLCDLAGDSEQPPLVRVSALDGLARRAERDLLAASDERVAGVVRTAIALVETEVPAADTADSPAGDIPDSDAAGSGVDTDNDHEPDERDLRATAVWALGMLPAEGELALRSLDALEVALASGDEWCVRYAIEALARKGMHARLEELQAAADAGKVTLSSEARAVLDQALQLG